MEIRIGKRQSGKTQDLLNEFLDDNNPYSVFVCFNLPEVVRVTRMISAALEASKFWPKGFKKTSPDMIKLKMDKVFTLEQTVSDSRPSGGRGFMYIDNLDMAIEVLAAGRGFQVKASTITK